MNHFFTAPDHIDGEKIYIEGSDVRHMRDVLRMCAGDELLISDGEGTDYVCEISVISEAQITCRIISRESSGTEPSVKFYLFQGLPKADKLEHVIQKSVELGVYRIIPTQTARSVVKYDDKKKQAKRERWQKIAESAAKQSRRGIIPEVCGITSFEEALKTAESLDMVLIPYENFKDMKSTKEIISSIRPGMNVGIFVGPEGGFETAEVDKAVKAGAKCISLGSRILRTETAPLMLLSVLMYETEKV